MFEFETSLLVCDGASLDLSAIKQTIGVFGHDPSQADPNVIAPSFANPFNPAKYIHWLICPSHQVQNYARMIVACVHTCAVCACVRHM